MTKLFRGDLEKVNVNYTHFIATEYIMHQAWEKMGLLWLLSVQFSTWPQQMTGPHSQARQLLKLICHVLCVSCVMLVIFLYCLLISRIIAFHIILCLSAMHSRLPCDVIVSTSRLTFVLMVYVSAHFGDWRFRDSLLTSLSFADFHADTLHTNYLFGSMYSRVYYNHD